MNPITPIEHGQEKGNAKLKIPAKGLLR